MQNYVRYKCIYTPNGGSFIAQQKVYFFFLDPVEDNSKHFEEEKNNKLEEKEDIDIFTNDDKVNSFDLDSYSFSEEEFFDCLGNRILINLQIYSITKMSI